jgi:hypothetical protein
MEEYLIKKFLAGRKLKRENQQFLGPEKELSGVA